MTHTVLAPPSRSSDVGYVRSNGWTGKSCPLQDVVRQYLPYRNEWNTATHAKVNVRFVPNVQGTKYVP